MGRIPAVNSVGTRARVRSSASVSLLTMPYFSASLSSGIWRILPNCPLFSEVRKHRPNLSSVTELIDLYLLWMSGSGKDDR